MLEKKYDFKKNEKMYQTLWQEQQLYQYNAFSKKPVYSIDTPPPTVSGHIHIGHIFSYTQAEIIARYRRMSGYEVFYPFGVDDNGLPTERLVEKDLGIVANQMDREDFVEICLKETQKYETHFKGLWHAMGFSCDWNLAYRTIDETSQRISQLSFIELAQKGKAYIDESPVLWCPECQTSIAQAELESKEKGTKFVTIAFDKNIHIATTRPEMLYGCVAIMIHPEDDRYTVLKNQMIEVPLFDFKVPVIADKKVDMAKGTGIVMCCTFGDITDLEWYKTYDLPYKKVLDDKGHIQENIPFIGGMYASKARKVIINKLDEAGYIIQEKEMDHTVSVHERCGTPIEILPSKQWYIDIMTNMEKYIEVAHKINWHPAHMKKRYLTWVENLKWNWCVSRQRFFGVPIPVWYCKACGKTMLATPEELPINPMTQQPSSKCSCGSDQFRPETAVLDTWATSSVTPLINKLWKTEKERDFFPMSLRTQAHEIIRTWAFYTIVKSVEHGYDIPWQDMMICGFVLSKPGEKISKSKSNAKASPEALIETHSADALRYWVANTKLGTDTFFDENELKISKRFLNKLWNASKFATMMLKDFKALDMNQIEPYDGWIVHRYHQTIEKAKAYLNQYEVGLARQIIDEFFWKDFCDHYLEYVKDRLYKTDLYEEARVTSGQHTLYYIMRGILKTYGIFTPFITEAIYQGFFRNYEEEPSIHLMLWDSASYDLEMIRRSDEIKSIMFDVRKFKSERQLSIKEMIGSIKWLTDDKAYLESCVPDLMACLHIKEIIIEKSDTVSVDIFE